MNIQDLFIKSVSRTIDGVIKADDDRNLHNELEEYVVTRDVARGLDDLTERYLNELTANGVWISGFFGSGKSHLLKILSLVLANSPLADDGARPADFLLPKVEDELVRANLAKCVKIPSRSVLFNIDQKFDAIGGDGSAAILEVFMKVLNELQGYYGKQGYIAQFERDLDDHGDFEGFKETYTRVNSSPWETDRKAITTARKAAFGKAYAEYFKVEESAAAEVIKEARADYRVSVETFAEMVKAYIDKQPDDFRLNFFVDEVGQFVGQHSQRMLNLQTVAETLGTVCKGRAWVFVTSQADLEGVLGAFHGMEAQDITKIMGRFKTKLTLASADVREVIQKRLLAKKEEEPAELTEIYDAEKDNLKTLFTFGDNSMKFKGWRGSDEFCAFYPFHTYQFDLFQLAIQQLSKHGVFTGQYLSVGERSMLAVFQAVAEAVSSQEVGGLATFDLMYDGLAPAIRGDMLTPFKRAEDNLGKGLRLQILKAMFLLKWVREFKATARNVAILLIDRPGIDVRKHEEAVADALALLESESYLQRDGELFEFLTDTEKDIEIEIKNTEIDEAQVSDLLCKVLFTDVLKDSKIRYEDNGQDYVFARKLDDHLYGKDADIAINVITMDHPDHANVNTLAAQNTGKPELLTILPENENLIEQARLFLKTQKYVQHNSGSTEDTRKAVLDQRSQKNSERRSSLQRIASELLTEAPLYINGSRLDTVREGEARKRFSKACQELVSFAFPKLKMLKGVYDDTTLSKAFLESDDLLSGGAAAPSEAEQEILNYVMRNQDGGQRTELDEIIKEFGKRPYGWYQSAVLTLVARLFGMGRVELRDPELLNARDALGCFKNSRKHSAVRVRLQEQFDAHKVGELKKFHQKFFDRVNTGTDARTVADQFEEALRTEVKGLTALLDQSGNYPFLKSLQPTFDTLSGLAEKDYTYLLNELDQFKGDLLKQNEELVSLIKEFMHGSQRTVYDEAMTFLRTEEANFAELDEAQVQPLRELAASSQPYQGNVVPTAKKHIETLRGQVNKLVADERARAIAGLDKKADLLQATDDFKALDKTAREQVMAATDTARESIENARFVTGIRDRLNRYITQEYPVQLTDASRLAAPAIGKSAGGKGKKATPPVIYTSVSNLPSKCKLSYMATPDDVEEWLDALRKAALAELEKGNRISF